MAKVVTGYSWSNEQITPALLNQMWTSSTFNSSAVDDSTTALSGGAVIVKDGGVTFAKLADVLDSDTMSGASATKLATSESIKAYIDSRTSDPARSYAYFDHSTVTGHITQNNESRPLWTSFTFLSPNNIDYILGEVSQNSDMSSSVRVGQTRISSEGTDNSGGQVTLIVPRGWYWRYSYSGTATITEKVHCSFML